MKAILSMIIIFISINCFANDKNVVSKAIESAFSCDYKNLEKYMQFPFFNDDSYIYDIEELERDVSGCVDSKGLEYEHQIIFKMDEDDEIFLHFEERGFSDSGYDAYIVLIPITDVPDGVFVMLVMIKNGLIIGWGV